MYAIKVALRCARSSNQATSIQHFMNVTFGAHSSLMHTDIVQMSRFAAYVEAVQRSNAYVCMCKTQQQLIFYFRMEEKH